MSSLYAFPQKTSDLEKLVATEKAFAKMARDESVKQAFLEFLADDGLIFQPAAVNGKDVWKTRPESPALLVKDDFRWVKGFGFADLENNVPAKQESSYRMASVTKPMTAIGILTLVEQGKIDLDAEVQKYVPYFPKKKYPVTIRQLLGYIGGISHYQNYDLEGHFKDHKNRRVRNFVQLKIR